MSAEAIPFKIQVECAGRRDEGKESLKLRYRRDESWSQRRGGHVERMAWPMQHGWPSRFAKELHTMINQM